MERHRRRNRLLLILSFVLVYGALAYFTALPLLLLQNITFIAIILVLPEYFFKVQAHTDPIRNMPAMLHRETRSGIPALRLGMEEAPLTVIKKVALSKRDETYGFIDFPYTNRIGSPLLFPVEQINSVREWLEENVPELEIIE